MCWEAVIPLQPQSASVLSVLVWRSLNYPWCQVNYIVDAVAKMVDTGARSMVLKPETLRNYKDFAVEAMKGVTITHSDDM